MIRKSPKISSYISSRLESPRRMYSEALMGFLLSMVDWSCWEIKTRYKLCTGWRWPCFPSSLAQSLNSHLASSLCSFGTNPKECLLSTKGKSCGSSRPQIQGFNYFTTKMLLILNPTKPHLAFPQEESL